MKLSRVQKFLVERVDRRSIQGAPYNPRTIDRHARGKLEKNLRKIGMVAPITVNRRSMRVVGGHQRLAIMDAIEGTDAYTLDVAMVDLSEAEERSQNVFLNNASAGGVYDDTLLTELLKQSGADVAAMGFDRVDLELMLPNEDFSSLFSQAAASPALVSSSAELDSIASLRDEDHNREMAARAEEKKIAEIKQAKRDHFEMARKRDDNEFIAILVFRDREEQTAFCSRVGADESARYIDGERVMRYLVPAP